MSEVTYAKVSEPCELGEGPHWDSESKQLIFVDCFVGDIHKLNPSTGIDEKINLERLVTLVVPWEGEQDNFVISHGKKLAKLNWKTKEVKDLVIVEEVSSTRFNDGKCDRKGRLYAGTMGLESIPGVVEHGLGSLYRLDSNYAITRMADKVSLSNGLAWSLDNQKMFYVDSAVRHVYVFDYDFATGNICNQKVLFDLNNNDKCKPQELPDGMTIDQNGKLWLACYNGGRVLRIDPETAAITAAVDLPATKTTSVAFGGSDLGTLFVTSAHKGLSDEERKAQPEAGCVFKVNFTKENVKGLPADKFIGA